MSLIETIIITKYFYSNQKKEDVNSQNLPRAVHFIGNLFEDKKLFKIVKDLESFIQK